MRIFLLFSFDDFPSFEKLEFRSRLAWYEYIYNENEKSVSQANESQNLFKFLLVYSNYEMLPHTKLKFQQIFWLEKPVKNAFLDFQ